MEGTSLKNGCVSEQNITRETYEDKKRYGENQK
jgi:hypothetical protein